MDFTLGWQDFISKNPFIYKKLLGQHFLKKPYIAEQIVGAATLKNNVVEIGPGNGILTQYLLEKSQEFNLILIETDSILCKFLRGHITHSNVVIVEGDALTFKYPSNTNIVSNLPYNISKRLIMNWMNDPNIETATIMVQKEVAYSLTANPKCGKEYKMISVLVNTFFHNRIVMDIAPKSFHPAPLVYSSVLVLKRKIYWTEYEYKIFLQILKKAFNCRGKKLGNIFTEEHIKGIDANRRPNSLSAEDFQIILHNTTIK